MTVDRLEPGGAGAHAPSEPPRREHLVGTLAALASAVILCVLVPAWIVTTTPSPPPGTPWPWTLLLLLWAGARLSHLVASGRPHLYSVTAWIFIYVWGGMAATLQLRTGLEPDTTPYLLPWTLGPAAAAILIGVAGLEAGAWLASRRQRLGTGDSQRGEGRARRISRSGVALATALTVGYLGFLFSRVGLGTFFSSREALASAVSGGFGDSAASALASGALLTMPLVTFHALVQLRRRERAEKGRAGYLIPTLVIGSLLLVSVNVISSPRSWFGTVLLSLAILGGATATVARTRATIAVLLLGMVLIFPAADTYRHADGDRNFLSQIDARQLATSGDYDVFAQTANTIAYVEHEGISWGIQALGSPLVWVPRSLWSGKPEDTGVIVARERGYDFTNLSAPLWAEAYINGGWPLVPVVMGIFGYFMRRADFRFATDSVRHAGSLASVSGAVLPFYMIVILRGSLLQATGMAIAFVAVLWLVSEDETLPQHRDP